jgi:hypothetical protein
MEKPEETIEELIEKMDLSSDEFKLLSTLDTLLTLLEKKYSISETTRGIVDGELTLFLIKKNNKDTFYNNIRQHLLLEVDQGLGEKIIKDILFFIDMKETQAVSDPISPTQALASIQERLSQASTIAPVKRDYSVEKPGEISSGTVTVPKPLAPDPYREMPEE